MLSRILTGLTVTVLVFALSVTGALWGFWRTLDNITFPGVSNPSQFLYGFGYGNATFGYGYGYGYGYGNESDGNLQETTTPAPIALNVWSVAVTVPTSTIITLDPASTVTELDVSVIAAAVVSTSGLNVGGDNPVAALDFGITGTKLNFSQPIRIDIPVTGYVWATIEIKVKHHGDTSFNTSGLTATPADSCTDGLPGVPSNIATVASEIATIYSCSASQFAAVTPSTGGWSSSTSSSSSSSSSSSTETETTTSTGSTEETSTGATTEPTAPIEESTTETETTTSTFSDTSGNWAESYIQTLAGLGIVVWNDNNEFEPDRVITRTEFLKMTTHTVHQTLQKLASEM